MKKQKLSGLYYDIAAGVSYKVKKTGLFVEISYAKQNELVSKSWRGRKLVSLFDTGDGLTISIEGFNDPLNVDYSQAQNLYYALSFYHGEVPVGLGRIASF